MKGVIEKSENAVKKSSKEAGVKKVGGRSEIKKRKRSKYIRMFAMGVAFNPVPL
jgi:hypothetical protein